MNDYQSFLLRQSNGLCSQGTHPYPAKQCQEILKKVIPVQTMGYTLPVKIQSINN